jgi:putative transposase
MKRNSFGFVGYDLYFYSSGLSLRRTSERLSCFIKRNHVSIWNWIQKYNPKKISSYIKKIAEYMIDETVVKFGSKFIWLWVAIELCNKGILKFSTSERSILVAEKFISGLIKIYDNIRFPQMVERNILKPAGF